MKRLFGTDGIRGVANLDLTSDLVVLVGRAAGAVVASSSGTVVVGRDTRTSGPMLEAALVAGLTSAGVDVALAGIIPTPAVAFLTVDEGARGGAVISASHNPVDDNGIKFFSAQGTKLERDLEEEIEERVADPEGGDVVSGTVETLDDAADRYVAHALGAISSELRGLRVVLDCAYGSAHSVAPRAFREAGADVVAINAEPDGTRINVDCGSTSMGPLAARVIKEGADLGIAFDGDADRALAVDGEGRPIDGDRILALSALGMHEAGELKNELVVATVMANLGFVRALESHGIEVVTVPVGDRFVAEAMGIHGAVLGGEQSGHLIYGMHSTTGDGLVTALKLAEVVASSDTTLAELAATFEPYPQVLLNVPVRDRDALQSAEALWKEIRAAEERLGDEGRVLVRASGTEPVVRVMVEARDGEIAEETARELAAAVARYLG